MRAEATPDPATARRPTPSRARLAAAVFALGCVVTAPAVGTELAEELKIFGHLTQAYGKTNRGGLLGASEDGTTNLRKVAIQLRWEKSPRDTIVIQLAHERRGENLFFPPGDEVEVDWAFYERRLAPHTAMKVGRLNVPLGIYNEIGDVGTLLPFFNLPLSFYAGVLSTAETIDGASIAHTFVPRSDWAVETEVYIGGWDTFQQRIDAQADFGIASLEARAEDGIGVNFWVTTPVQGLRLGGGAMTWQLEGPISVPGGKDRWDSYHASLDLTRDAWVVRAEARRWRFEQDFGRFVGGPSLPAGAERRGHYFQLGHWPTQRIGLFVQWEEISLAPDAPGFDGLDDFHQDLAVSLNYRLGPDLVSKLEYHQSDTRIPLGRVPLQAPAPGAPAVEVDWFIASFSVSF